ncbi:MAG: helix-turn-helix domain containing protein [Bifidobacteriaceae bacterium]|nr:helix-turn-helix domain containing protein [Bifidobacteriaceae bacterium]
MRPDARVHYDEEFRKQVVAELEAGHGKRYLSTLFEVSTDVARNWVRTFKAAGAAGILNMGTRSKKYSYDTKLAAVRDHIDGGISTTQVMAKYAIVSPASLERWYRLYREGGIEALKPRRNGPRKSTTIKNSEDNKKGISQEE